MSTTLTVEGGVLEILRALQAPMDLDEFRAALPTALETVMPGGRPVTEFEQAVLTRAHPFLVQLHRNALTVTELRRGRGLDAAAAALADAGLTPREAEIVLLVAQGHANRAIADELIVSVRTVHKHLENAFRKLGVRSRSEAAAQVWAA